jgi:prepilin-type processing-associated H-X9-DG protein
MDMWGGNTLYDSARINTSYDVARLFMVGEAVTDIAPPSWFYPAWWPYPEYHEFLHHDQADVAFVDGHVKNCSRGAVFSDYPGLLQ